MTDGLDALRSGPRVVPVITLASAGGAEPLAEALAEGGITCAEAVETARAVEWSGS